MTEPATPTVPRPRQATFLGVLVMVGSAMVVFLAFQQMSSLGSLDTQESLGQMLRDEPLASSGIGVGDLQNVLHVLCLIAGVVGTLGAAMGQQLMTGSALARKVLTGLVPFHLTAGLIVGGIAAGVVAGATIMLWAEPTRSWLAGRVPPEPLARTRAAAAVATGAPAAPLAQPGQAGGQLGALPNPYAAPPPPAQAAGPRPSQVTTACLIALITSALTALALAAAVVQVAVAGDQIARDTQARMEEMTGDSTISADTIIALTIGMFVLMIVWAIVAAVIAALALTGRGWARIALIVSASCSALMSLLGILAVVPLVITALSVLTVVLLCQRPASAWFSAQRRTPSAR